MAYVINATWIARPGAEDAVRQALRELAEHSRAESGNRAYVPFEDPDDPRRLGIFEVYDDEQAFARHVESAHFQEIAIGRAIPLLDERTRQAFSTLD